MVFRVATLLLVIQLRVVHAQEFPMQYFDVDEGLPTTRVEHLRILESGKLFVGGRGIASIYDGYNFKELNSKAVIWYWFSAKDQDGTLWFIDGGNCMTKIENGRIVAHPAFENLKDNYNRSLHTSLAFDENNTAYIGCHKSWIMLKADSSGNVSKISLRDSFPGNSVFVDTRLASTPVFGSSPGAKQVGNTRSLYVNGKLLHQSAGTAFKVKCIQLGNRLVISADKTLFVVDGEKVDEWQWDDLITTFFEDTNGRLWVGARQGAYIVSIDNRTKRRVLKERFVTSICQDREGHVWIGTTNGLFKTRSLNIHNFFEVDGERLSHETAPAVFANDSQIFFLGEPGAFTFKDDGIVKATNYEHLPWKLHAQLIGNTFWVRSANGMLGRVRRDGEEVKYRLNGELVKGISSMKAGSDGNMWITKPPSILRVNDDFKTDTIIRDAVKLLNDGRRVDLMAAQDGAVYLRQMGRLYKWKDDTLEKMTPTRDGVTLKQVSDLAFRNDMLAIGTMWDGIWLIHRDTHFIKCEGLFKPRTVEVVEWGNDSTIWVGGSTGLFRVIFHFSEDGQMSTNIKSWGKAEGLPISDISRIKMHRGKLWVGTRFGISYLDPTELDAKKSGLPKASLKWIRLNDTTEFEPDGSETQRFSYRNNRLTFGFASSSFRVDKYYSYRLKGLSDKWTTNKDTFASYSFIPPGDYVYEVKSVDPRNKLESDVTSWSFTISKPFWQRAIFLVPTGLALQLLVLGLILGVSRSKRKRADLEKGKLQSEIKALRAQFNPHFVFNALGAIQETMMSGNRDEAVGNMSKLASLMRKMLEATRRKRTQLSEVEEILNLYLDLEMIRQPGRFSYQITLDQESSESADMINVPISLIQPFVENAAIHGAPSAKDHGEILLHFSIDGDYLFTEVKDNGRGINTPSTAYGHDHTESIGLSLVKEQINLMNKELEQDITLEIESEKGSGTRITLRTPLNF